MTNNFRRYVVDAMMDHLIEHGTDATTIWLTPLNEERILEEMKAEQGAEHWGEKLCEEVRMYGLRASLPKMFGLTVVWDALKFRISSPMTDIKLADVIIDRLNDLIKDPATRVDIGKLIDTRVAATSTTCLHPTLQTVDGFLGVLGLINGLVGVHPDGPRKGWGYIAADFGDDDKLIRFIRTPMPGEKP